MFRGCNMNRVIVCGGKRLSGEVLIGGSKNAALPLLFAGILTREECTFSNLPRVSDVLRTLEILRALGARIHFCENHDVCVDYSTLRSAMPPPALTGVIRGSTYLLGAMLGRFGEVRFARSGGCDFGVRPIDQHLAGFEALGAVVAEGEVLTLVAPRGLTGACVTLAMPSVGASANLLLAACTAQGVTEIHNAAAEPHVAALADFLIAAGACISGVGTDTLRVVGVPRLHGVTHRIIPDMIEAGTYLCAGVACGGPVCVRDVEVAHLGALLDTFSHMGAQVSVGDRCVTVACEGTYRGAVLQTGPYPAFPTDLHPQMTALLSIGGRCVSKSVVRECVFASRFGYIAPLQEMGAHITVEGDRAGIEPAPLHRARVRSPDLRGGAALLIAALATDGVSEIYNAATIGRGYEHLAEKLALLGAEITVK